MPVKRLEESKGRLAATLTPAQRRELGLAMLADVLAASSGWTPLVVTSDPAAAGEAREAGCEVLSDPGDGLNPAVLSGLTLLNNRGAGKVVVLPCDVPLAESAEIRELFDLDGVAVAPSGDGGTNCLLLSPPGIISPAFGPGSAHAHKVAALEAGASFTWFYSDGFDLDVDSWADLERLAGAPAQCRSRAVAAALISEGRRPANPGKAAEAPSPW
ncbi:MAG: 2-phospho-L-lactate guanylyltransferase [Actinomycetota bacterium]